MKIRATLDITSCLLDQLSLKIREMTNVDKDAEKREPLHTVGGNANLYRHYGKQNGVFSKN